MTTLGLYIKKYRKEKGISLRELATKSDLSYAYIHKLEKGIDPNTKKEILPTVETLNRLAKGMNLPVEVLLEMSGVNFNTSTLSSEDTFSDSKENKVVTNTINSELAPLMQQLQTRPILQQLLTQTQNMSDKEINKIIRVITLLQED